MTTKENKKTGHFLESERIFLRAVSPEDACHFERWFNEPEVTLYLNYGQLPTNEEEIFEMISEQKRRGDILFIVVDKKTKEAIGLTGLHDINSRARKAEYRVFIGEKKYWGKGLGTEITELVTFYGFDRLNLNRIYLGFTADNEKAGKAYEKSGYVKEGILKQDLYRNGRYYDSIKMAVLREDYLKKFYKDHFRRFSPLK